MNFFKLIYFCLLPIVLIVNSSHAQANKWAIVLTPKLAQVQQKTVISSMNIDEQYLVNYKAKHNLVVQEYIISNLGFSAVFSNKYSKQKFVPSKTFPSDAIKNGWNEGLRINKLYFIEGIYFLVMNDMHKQRQSVSFPKNADGLKKTIDSFYKTHDIENIAVDKDKFIVVKSEKSNPSTTLYNINKIFPEQWIKEQQVKGYYVKDIHFIENSWIVLMTLDPNYPKQVVILGNSLSSNFMDVISKHNYMIEKCIFGLNVAIMEQDHEKYMAEGNKLMKAKKYEDAIEFYTEAINTFKYDKEPYLARMEARYKSGHKFGCYNDAKFVVDYLDKNNEDALFNMAILAYNTNDYESEFKAWNSLLAKSNIDNEDRASYLNSRGTTFAELGFFTKAKADFQNSLKYDPSGYAAASMKELNQTIKDNEPIITNLSSRLEKTIVRKSELKLNVGINSELKAIQKIEIYVNDNKIPFTKTNLSIASNPFNYGITFNAILKNGNNKIEVYVYDSEGNETSEEYEYVYIPENKVTYHALLIGNNNYKHSGIFPNLKKPISDVRNLEKVLTTQYKFDKHNVEIVENASKNQIIEKLRELQLNLKANDQLLIFYAGHGEMDSVKTPTKSILRGYWLPVDAMPGAGKSNWLNTSEISGYINNMKASKVLVVSDACFSGSLIDERKNITNSIFNTTQCNVSDKTPTYKIMTSGNLSTVSDESIFLANFLTLLKNNTQPCITSGQIFPKIKTINNSKSKIDPQYGVFSNSKDEEGEFIFEKR